jgi:outer membrane protein insertion porin family
LKILFSLLLLFYIAHANIKEIKLEGLTQISHKIALEKIDIEKDSQINKDQLNQSLKELYEFGYFNDIEIIEENDIITFKFTEKPFIVNIEMENYKTREEDLDALYATMNIKKGKMYSKALVENSKKILLEELEKEGYINSVVEVVTEHINKESVAIKYIVNKGDEVLIKKVNYVGAKALNAEHFEENTANKEEDLVSWWFGQNDGAIQFEQLEYDSYRIKDIYLQHGYLDAKVSPAFSRIDYNTKKAELNFNITEGVQYKNNNIIIYTDESIVPLKELEEGLKQLKGKTFNIAKLRQDVEFIRTKIADKGYAYTDVSYDIRKDREKQNADVIIHVTPGEKVYINDVIISGNSRTLDRVIRRNVYLAPKDLFNLTDFKDSKSALNRTGFFEIATLKQKRINKNLMDLEVHVKETATGSLTLGGGYGSYDGWMINASINDNNIFGSGLNLGLSLEHSEKKDTAKISLKNPAIYDSIYNGSFSIYKQESTITKSSSDTTLGDKTTETTGGSLGIGRALTRHARIGATYALEDAEVAYSIDTSENYQYITSSITPYISYNDTDNYFIPRSGITTGSSFKYAGIGGDAKYTQSTTYFKYFLGLEDTLDYDLIFRYKTQVKVMNDLGDIPSGTSYYLGGATSVRGYQSYAFQPDDNDAPYKKSLVNTFELSFPLMPKAKMRWALFYDHGMIGEEKFNKIKKSGYGASINWYSPVGPLQFIFARAISPEPDDKTSNFEFSLGTSF